MFTIEEYPPREFAALKEFMIQLQDYLVTLDPWKLLKLDADYGWYYTNDLLNRRVGLNHGRIFLARHQAAVIGMIAGIMERPSFREGLEMKPVGCGRIIELFVVESYRGKGVADALVETIEIALHDAGARLIRIEAFVPNERAIKFYQRRGYIPRTVDLARQLSDTK